VHYVLSACFRTDVVPVVWNLTFAALAANCSDHLSVPLLHGPDGDDKATADAEDSRQLPQRPHPALRRRKVVDHGHWEDGVETLVPERQGQVVAQQRLQAGDRNTLIKQLHWSQGNKSRGCWGWRRSKFGPLSTLMSGRRLERITGGALEGKCRNWTDKPAGRSKGLLSAAPVYVGG
jgi:hypothetical protein